jgi:hypothetical protein
MSALSSSFIYIKKQLSTERYLNWVFWLMLKENNFPSMEILELTEKFLYSKRSGFCDSDCPISFAHKHNIWVMPRCLSVCVDRAARAPPIYR